MKVKVKIAFFDNDGLHKKGDIIETNSFDENLMEKVAEKVAEKKVVKKSEK